MKKRGIEEVEVVISRSLQIGVLLSAVVMLAGMLMFFITGSSGYPADTFPTGVGAILQGIVALKPYAIILAGLMLLIITPVFRVGVSIIEFAKEKDFRYVWITTLVFVILIISFLMGKVE